MTTKDILQWIKTNLAPVIQQALYDGRQWNPDQLYTEPWLAGMICRETGILIAKYAPSGQATDVISSLMRGDFSQRPHDTEKKYHGFGFIQIDIDAYPGWVKSGAWKDPYKNIRFAIGVLEEKREYLQKHFPDIAGDSLNHYITAAFNCGQGNEAKVIEQEKDPDAYTAGHNYSNQVFEFADIYASL